MAQMTQENLHNIKCLFQEKTGTVLQPLPRRQPMKRVLLLAAILACCALLAAFTVPLFTPLEGDELTLVSSYQGDGIVSVYVENNSEKALTFQAQTKLFDWSTGEEILPNGNAVPFENVRFPSHSSGTMTIDLSKAYDIQTLEASHPGNSYYLLLTNNGFLFGHDWMCSFSFHEKEEPAESQPHLTETAQTIEEMEQSLQFYFEDTYYDEVMAFNEQNFNYLQKVDEVITRFAGRVISPVNPIIMVSGPSITLDPQPRIQLDTKHADFQWMPLDGYGRIIGAAASEKALTVTASVSSSAYPDSTRGIPLIYTLVYETSAITDDAFAFFYGQFHSFADLASNLVHQDEHYTIYNITDFLYTDLEAYLQFLKAAHTDLNWSEETCQQIRELYTHYMQPGNLHIHYFAP